MKGFYKMPKYLIYLEIDDLHKLDEALGPLVDDYSINGYFTLTEDGAPIVFDKTMVGDPDYCNGLALRCAGITEG
jgi:hypothetical protein